MLWREPHQGWLYWAFWALVVASVLGGLIARLAGCQGHP